MLKAHKDTRRFSKASAGKLKIAIIRSEFNPSLTENLESYCRKTLITHGVKKKNISTFQVPGSLEIPIVAKVLAKKKRYDVIIALGVIIKGDTYHFEMIANECARGCMDVALEYEVPIIFEVLATYTEEQAQLRAGKNRNNKGIEAAIAALKVSSTLAETKKRR